MPVMGRAPRACGRWRQVGDGRDGLGSGCDSSAAGDEWTGHRKRPRFATRVERCRKWERARRAGGAGGADVEVVRLVTSPSRSADRRLQRHAAGSRNRPRVLKLTWMISDWFSPASVPWNWVLNRWRNCSRIALGLTWNCPGIALKLTPGLTSSSPWHGRWGFFFFGNYCSGIALEWPWELECGWKMNQEPWKHCKVENCSTSCKSNRSRSAGIWP